MMRNSYLGMNALFILFFQGLGMVAEALGYVPFSRTLFFPMFLIVPLMLGLVGWREKDKKKGPAIAAMVISILLILYWIVLLVIRLKNASA